MIGMAETAGGERFHFTLYSWFGVVSTTNCGRANSKSIRSKGAQARRVEMLDHLDHGRGVEAFKSLIAIHERAVQQLHPLGLGMRQRILAAIEPWRFPASGWKHPARRSPQTAGL